MSDGFSAEERAAMKERAAELRAEGKKGAKRANGLQQVLDKIAEFEPADRELAERLHVLVSAVAPDLGCKTWYGMPAYTNADGKIVVFFRDAAKFKSRYATVGFEEAAQLDDGEFWPTSYALLDWTPAVEKKLTDLVRRAVG
ncbi:iron chaperone [Branchiibius cervicis]|uniref:Iron chaperone n=1 Tax=Branchiibius cervicis TaxID=908252 RepID=A0ABW2AWQ8_9MICO